MEQLVYIREWGGQFVTAVPVLHIELGMQTSARMKRSMNGKS
jgi:hypothetical protein